MAAVGRQLASPILAKSKSSRNPNCMGRRDEKLRQTSGKPDQTASFSSLAGRKATFLEALMWICSPVAGLRPMRAARLRT